MFTTENIDVRLRRTHDDGSPRSVFVSDAVSILGINIGAAWARVDCEVVVEWVSLLNVAAGESETHLDARTLLCVARVLAGAVERGEKKGPTSPEIKQRQRDAMAADAELDEACGVPAGGDA